MMYLSSEKILLSVNFYVCSISPPTNKTKIIFKKKISIIFFFWEKYHATSDGKMDCPMISIIFLSIRGILVLLKRTRGLTLCQSTTRVHRNQTNNSSNSSQNHRLVHACNLQKLLLCPLCFHLLRCGKAYTHLLHWIFHKKLRLLCLQTT